MSTGRRADAGASVVAELEETLLSPSATAAEKDGALCKLALLMEEHGKRNAHYSK